MTFLYIFCLFKPQNIWLNCYLYTNENFFVFSQSIYMTMGIRVKTLKFSTSPVFKICRLKLHDFIKVQQRAYELNLLFIALKKLNSSFWDFSLVCKFFVLNLWQSRCSPVNNCYLRKFQAYRKNHNKCSSWPNSNLFLSKYQNIG